MQRLDPIKRGDSLGFYAVLTDESGLPVPGIAANLKSQVRDNQDVLVADLTITEDATIPGKYLLQCSDTSNWPVGTMLLDIQWSNNGIVTSTDTIQLPVQKDVTK
jgi:hypothetical protein